MSDLGQFQGQWLGKWHGGVGDLPEGFIAGNATFAINAFGDLTTGDEASHVVRGRVVSFDEAHREWEAKRKWRDDVMQWADITPVESVQEVVQETVQATPKTIEVEAVLPRLYEPVESLAELVADARLLQLDEARALESAMAVRDVLAIAELAYLAEVAVQQEKDAIAAFLMFMD
jgi:hypothetical protein